MSIDPKVWALIREGAKARGLDPYAVGAVALSEGGLQYGAVGDQGTSFGPFQLHVGGALPRGRGAAWANSPAGINYALDHIARVAAGMRGKAAISNIVRRFERPADPDSEISRALSHYDTLGGMVADMSADPQGASTPTRSVRTPKTIPGAQFAEVPQAPTFTFNEAKMSSDILGLFAQGGGQADLSKLPGIVESAQKWTQPEPIKVPKMPSVTATTPGQPSRTPQSAATPAAPAAAGKVAALPLGTKLPGGSEFNVSDPEGAPSASGGRYHSAKDWFSPGGSAVYSPEAGKIVEITPSRGNAGQIYGGVVKVQMPDGRVWVFRHVNPAKLKLGQKVDAGTPIASVVRWQDNPRSSHAHIELWKTLKGGYNHENMLDPMDWFR